MINKIHNAFEDGIKNNLSCYYMTDDTMRGIGKTKLLVDLAVKYRIPIVVPTQSSETYILSLKNYFYPFHSALSIYQERNVKNLLSNTKILFDEGLHRITISNLENQGLIPFGFIYTTNSNLVGFATSSNISLAQNKNDFSKIKAFMEHKKLTENEALEGLKWYFGE